MKLKLDKLNIIKIENFFIKKHYSNSTKANYNLGIDTHGTYI